MNKKLFLIVSAVTAIGLPLAANADVHSAQYKGANVCAMCHKNTHKAIVDGYQNSAHSKAMQKADTAGAIVGDFSSNTAFKKDQVAFTLGSGRTEQAYLDANLKVLPATWDAKAKAWKATSATDGTQCVACHTTGFDPKANAPVSALKLGVSCESCHGPGSEHVAAPKTSPVVHPQDLPAAQRAMVCGQCHSVGKDTTGSYNHPVGYRPGDDLTKFFVDAKPTTAGRNQQYSEYITSKHSQVGIGCVNCHDPHDTVGTPGQLKKPVTDLCLQCHAGKVKDLATHAPGAPAGATCATCHMPGGRHIFAKPGK